MKFEKIEYPKPILEFLSKTAESLHDSYISDGEVYELDDIYAAAEEVLGKTLLELFLNGNELVLHYDSEEAATLVFFLIHNLTVLYSLRRKGLIDIIEDENGEEIAFITEKGRQLHDKVN